jgi:hypothetical protein
MGQKISFWKQTADNKGAAALFNTTPEGYTFVRMMPQTGEKSFDFNSSINVSLGEFDMGSMLAVLKQKVRGLGKYNEDKKQFGGLVHNPNDGVYSFINMSWIDDTRLVFGLSFSDKGQGINRQYRIGLTDGEQEALIVFLEEAVKMRFAANLNAENERRNNNANGGGNDGGGQAAPTAKRSTFPAATPAPAANTVPKRPTVGANAAKTVSKPRVETVAQEDDENVPI